MYIDIYTVSIQSMRKNQFQLHATTSCFVVFLCFQIKHINVPDNNNTVGCELAEVCNISCGEIQAKLILNLCHISELVKEFGIHQYMKGDIENLCQELQSSEFWMSQSVVQCQNCSLTVAEKPPGIYKQKTWGLCALKQMQKLISCALKQ